MTFLFQNVKFDTCKNTNHDKECDEYIDLAIRNAQFHYVA